MHGGRRHSRSVAPRHFKRDGALLPARVGPAYANKMHAFDFVLHRRVRTESATCTAAGATRGRSHPVTSSVTGPCFLLVSAPPMPTKCTRLTLYFIAGSEPRALHARRPAPLAVGRTPSLQA